MSALEWHALIPVGPAIGHSNGMVIVTLDGRTVVFPSEAAARFFFEAYADVPNLAGQNAVLRQQIDEGALATAQAQVVALTAELEGARRTQDELEGQLATLAETAARAVQRARLLACALKRKVTL